MEKVYENALIVELRAMGLSVRQQVPIAVLYRDVLVGEYFSDIVVEGRVIVELKAAEQMSRAHEAQLLNYLKATRFDVGLLINFGKTAECKRKIYDIESTKPFSSLLDPCGRELEQRIERIERIERMEQIEHHQ